MVVVLVSFQFGAARSTAAEPFDIEETDLVGTFKKRIKFEVKALAVFDAFELQVKIGRREGKIIVESGRELDAFETMASALAETSGEFPCFLVTTPPPAVLRSLSGAPIAEDGVVPGSPVILLRDSLVDRILGLTNPNQFSLILIKAPPASGKTTLLQFLSTRFEQSGVQPIVIRFFPNQDPHKQIPVNAKGEIDVPNGSIILADECQYAYSHPEFWPRLSKAASKWFHFIGVATYHFGNLPDSPTVTRVVTFDDIKLNEAEASQLYQNYLQAFNFVNPSFEGLKDLVLRQCNGHPGMIKESLSQLQALLKPNNTLTEADCIKLVLSNDFVTGYRRIWASTLHLQADDRNALSRWLLDRALNLMPALPRDLLYRLARAFVIVDESNPEFWCPLVERRLLRQIFPSRATQRFEGTILELVVEVVQTFPSLELQNACKAGTREFPMEAAFQHLFLVGLASVLPPDQEIVPEKTMTNIGGYGRVDFFINGNKNWALELLVQSDRLESHSNRFLTGPYALVTKEYLLVDFCLEERRSVQTDIPGHVVVGLSNDFTRARITTKGFSTDVCLR
eukprot:c20741_g2_i1.p1 GENE.c20741_g2_i1~~c20741_g2_i1.p1  ORF type:complete len:578 (+),score=84.66 c20741_g2_i1:34-1734(+)